MKISRFNPSTFQDEFKQYKQSLRGAGDLVASFAQPIARAIDGVLGTDVQNCGGCAERQAALNKAIPFAQAEKKSPENNAGH